MIAVRPTVIAPGVYQVPALGAKVTVIRSQDGAVLVDTGARGSWPLVAAGLRRLGLSPKQIRLVVLTHYHPDHSGALKKLVKDSGVAVAIHRTEAGFINGQEQAPNPFTSPLLAGMARPFLPWLHTDPVPVDYALEDGDILPFPEEVRVIHTPGHTQGSICLYLPSHHLLIAGDALQNRFRRLGPPARRVTRNPQQATTSLEKLLVLDLETICFSHFAPLRQGAHQALSQLVRRIHRNLS